MDEAKTKSCAIFQLGVCSPRFMVISGNVEQGSDHDGEWNEQIHEGRVRGNHIDGAEDQRPAVPEGKGSDDDDDLSPLNQSIGSAQSHDKKHMVVSVDVNDVVPAGDEEIGTAAHFFGLPRV